MTTTTDRELLELAAKAAGIVITIWSNCQAGGFQSQEAAIGAFWNPLTDDGDALRLAVKLGLTVTIGVARDGEDRLSIDESSDPYAATRRAIVRAAAEIGRSMK